MTNRLQIHWSYPRPWETAKDSNYGHETGVYQISRFWAGEERLLYVGLVKSERRSFYQRMNEHRRDWVGERRGLVHFRFGVIKPFSGLAIDPQLVEEVEGALILLLQPEYNSKKRKSYSTRGELVILSIGNRGFAPPELSTELVFD